MGQRGPRPTPTSILAARGSEVATYERKGEPADEIGVPEMPAGLPDAAQKHWNYIVPKLVTRRTLSAADLGTLAGMCRWWARYVAAATAVDGMENGGEPFSGHQMDHPRLRERAAWQEYSKAAKEFGLSPAAKARVVADVSEKKSDPRSSILNSGLRISESA